jgi:cytochrome c oxidase cbb3-type subunit 3/ubiquinol-cytochrome c reductase cytochrome c subunit
VRTFHAESWRLLTFLLFALASGCDFPGKPREADRPARADEVESFDALYRMRCAGCHGVDGKLGPAPPLNDPVFLAIVPDAELRHVISEGRAVSRAQRSPMPGFARARGGPLTDAQVQVLADGIKKRWRPAASGEAPPPYLTPTGTWIGNANEGARVFARACAGCHGRQGEGGEHDGRSVGAINEPAFLALISDTALRRTMITGRPDLGMPAYNGTDGRTDDFRPLSSAQIDNLMALLTSWRHGGTTGDH